MRPVERDDGIRRERKKREREIQHCLWVQNPEAYGVCKRIIDEIRTVLRAKKKGADCAVNARFYS